MGYFDEATQTWKKYDLRSDMFYLVYSQQKTIEGRPITSSLSKVLPGHRIEFFNKDDLDEMLLVQVQSVEVFKSVYDMLNIHITRALPGYETVNQGIQLYKQCYPELNLLDTEFIAIHLGEPTVPR